jgi:multidrug efflux pump subunit AcrA (membrane-fusion protein)
MKGLKRWLLWAFVLIAAGAGYVAWLDVKPPSPEGLAARNGQSTTVAGGGASIADQARALLMSGWRRLWPERLPEGFASGNGRIEAVEIDIATKTPGRLKDIVVGEGDFVTAGQLLAQDDLDVVPRDGARAKAAQRREAASAGRSSGSAFIKLLRPA